MKISQWMQADDPHLFSEWQERPLQLQFSAFVRLIPEGSQSDIPLLVSINIAPPNVEEDDVGCEILLNFMTSIGMSMIMKVYLSKLSAYRVFRIYGNRPAGPSKPEHHSQHDRSLD